MLRRASMRVAPVLFLVFSCRVLCAAPVHARTSGEGVDDEAAPVAESSPSGPLRRAGEWVARQTLALEPTDPSQWRDLPLSLGRRVLWDAGYLLTAPTRWDRCDWTRFALFATATGGALLLDDPIDVASREHNPRSQSEGDVEDAIQKFAELPGIAAVLGGGYAYSLVTGNEEARRMTIDTGEALLLSSVVLVEPLKLVTGRARPREGRGPYHWFAGGTSFPSGHTTAAFSLATGVSEYAHYDLRVAVPMYALATGVGVARIRADAHFLSDVFVGATLGILTTKSVIWLSDQRRQRHDRLSGIVVAPMVDRDVRGVQVVVPF
jgi:membrane-associated phospholipid phosphatase